MAAVPPRFYVPDVRAAGDVVDLPDEEAEHATRVLRLKTGDRIIVFNGRGQAFEAIADVVQKRGIRVRIDAISEAAREPRVAITLVQAVLKGDKMDDVVRDAVMVGVSAIQPIVTTRSEIALPLVERSRRRERWERIAVSSAKQSGRAVLPAVLPPQSFAAVISQIDERRLPSPALMLAEPSSSADAIPLGEVDRTTPRESSVLIGPEGGWTSEEIAAAAATCQLVTLGGRTIRADAMALVATAALFAHWGEYA